MCDPAGVIFDDTIRHLSDLDQMAFRFAGSNNLAALRWLFVYGANSNVRDSASTSLLHVAARTGSSFIVKDLVRRGCSCDAIDKAGWTPLHVASCMGRHDVSLYLLQSGGDAEAQNFKGQKPQDLCSSSRTKDVVVGYDSQVRLRPRPAEEGAGSASSGLHFEPFFVPRESVLSESRFLAELQKLGLELFNISPGHGIAFVVAAGVVPDYPVNINRWLTQMGASPGSYGDYLGSDYPIAQTLRLEFLNSLQLLGTGVVSALQVAFHRAAVPKDWQRLDRLLRGISHFWWQQHNENEVMKLGEATGLPRESGSSSSTSLHVSEELSGMGLFRCLGSTEGLHRLFFSTVMLHQWFQSGHQLTFSEWTQLNMCIDDRGTDVPMQVQKGIYDTLAREHICLARTSREGPILSPSLEGWAFVRYSGRAQVSHDGDTANWFQQTPRLLAAQGGVSSAGRASVAPGGLEPMRNEEVDDSSVSYHVAEVSSQLHERALDENEERAWIVIHQSVLFLSQAPNSLPYGFVSLPRAVLSHSDETTGHLLFTGRQVSRSTVTPLDGDPPCIERASWLEMCLLLSDGRYQLLEAPHLDLRIASTEFDSWAQYFRQSCTVDDRATYRV